MRRQILSRMISTCLAAGACVLAAVTAHAACGSDAVKVEGSPVQIEAACRARFEMRSYFEGMGFAVALPVSIKFSDVVYIRLYDSASGKPAARFQVSGYFDASRKHIEVTSAWSKFRKARRPWGMRWGHPIAYSILQHEIAHAALHEVLSDRNRRVSKAWTEFLAYSIQIDMMELVLKSRVLGNYAQAKPFEHAENVNPFVYGSDPDTFGIRAHLFTQARGGRDFLRRIIVGDVEFSTEELLWTR